MVPRFLLGHSACVLSASQPLGRCTADTLLPPPYSLFFAYG